MSTTNVTGCGGTEIVVHVRGHAVELEADRGVVLGTTRLTGGEVSGSVVEARRGYRILVVKARAGFAVGTIRSTGIGRVETVLETSREQRVPFEAGAGIGVGDYEIRGWQMHRNNCRGRKGYTVLFMTGVGFVEDFTNPAGVGGTDPRAWGR